VAVRQPAEPAPPRQQRRYDVYDADGTLLFELTMPGAMAAARGETVYSTVVDPEFGVQFIERLRIIPLSSTPSEGAR
jgi:hypothetical protein